MYRFRVLSPAMIRDAFPLWKRGIEGDYMRLHEIPPAPLFKGGEIYSSQ